AVEGEAASQAAGGGRAGGVVGAAMGASWSPEQQDVAAAAALLLQETVRQRQAATSSSSSSHPEVAAPTTTTAATMQPAASQESEFGRAAAPAMTANGPVTATYTANGDVRSMTPSWAPLDGSRVNNLGIPPSTTDPTANPSTADAVAANSPTADSLTADAVAADAIDTRHTADSVTGAPTPPPPLTPLQSAALRLLPAMRPADALTTLSAVRTLGCLPTDEAPEPQLRAAGVGLMRRTSELSDLGLLRGLSLAAWLSSRCSGGEGGGGGEKDVWARKSSIAPSPVAWALADELAERVRQRQKAAAAVTAVTAAARAHVPHDVAEPGVTAAAAASNAASISCSSLDSCPVAIEALRTLAAAGMRHQGLVLAVLGVTEAAAAEPHAAA
ncbi:hypothetical protein Agub_g14399, partial [Astrephomene gubernaculifera]